MKMIRGQGAGRGPMIWLAVVLGGAALTWAGNHFGLWWLALLVGALAGLLLRGRATPGLAALLAVWLGWGGDLAVQATHADIAGAAGVLAAIVGFSKGQGVVIFVVAFLFASLLALAGAWLGVALRRGVTAFGPERGA